MRMKITLGNQVGIQEPCEEFLQHLQAVETQHWFDDDGTLILGVFQSEDPVEQFTRLIKICVDLNMTAISGQVNLNHIFGIVPFDGFGVICGEYGWEDSHISFES
jgi:hypothetical protein